MTAREIFLIAHRIAFALVICSFASTLIQLISRPVTMATDHPATSFLLVVATSGLVVSWIHLRLAIVLLIVCDILLVSAALAHFA